MSENICKVSDKNEKRTLIVIIFTIVTMVAEILYGYITHSMSLLADGYHMGTHAVALSLTYIAYILIRKFSGSQLFPNGTDKIGTLTAYTSSIFLGFTGLWIIAEAFERFVHPLNIQFNEAIIVAVIGLVVNAICILIIGPCEEHPDSETKDYNFVAAYYHILADALTSIFAIAALVVGKYFGLIFFDSIVGILGGLLILKWAVDLLKETIKILIDMH